MGILNYGSATGSAPLAPLYVGYPPYSIHFGYTVLPCPRNGQFHKLSCKGAFLWHGRLLTGDMSGGMRRLFMAWGTWGVLNACAWWGGLGLLLNTSSAHFPHNAGIVPQISHISPANLGESIQTRLTSILGVWLTQFGGSHFPNYELKNICRITSRPRPHPPGPHPPHTELQNFK